MSILILSPVLLRFYCALANCLYDVILTLDDDIFANADDRNNKY